MSNESILVVDDHPLNLKLTTTVLSHAGYTVKTATDAEEALEVLRTFVPRLILMDVQLPGVDGLELTRRIKSQPAWKDITIVALTAYAMKADEDRARLAGCDGYISKPISTRTFPDLIAGFLSRRHYQPWTPPPSVPPSPVD